MNISLFIDDEYFEDILRKGLIESYNMVKHDKIDIPIFSTDPEKERKKLKKLLKSFECIINWYSSPDEWKEFKNDQSS